MTSETTKPDRERGGDERSAGEEAAPAFKVIDRRRFAPDGSERSGEEGEPSEPQGRARPAPPTGRDTGARERPDSASVSSASSPQGPAPHLGAPSHENAGMPVGEAYGDERGVPTEPTFA
ncbi:MAG TPA: hypothetical protein VEI94_06540, partial [Candidatus Bathyarchaeia archaeon]|nr:hypothetical protein [Candidatus Bathyarchaeia archaeon]